MLERARAAGRMQEMAQALRIIDQRLRTDPLDFGEVYRSRGNVHEHTAFCDFIQITFAVCTERKLVLVRDCRIMSGRGL